MNNQEIKLSQYADDTTFILDGTKESLTATFHLLESFSLSSGLRINYKKTEALWIGSCVGKEENLLPEKNIQWNESKVKFLGVWLSTDPKITLRTNYDEKLEKIRIVLNSWKLRRLTLIGKIVVLKSLAASHLPYILAPLETDERFLKEINQIFYDFLWNNKGDKIKRSVLINSYDKGGLKMIDIFSYNKSLKLAWVKKYLDAENMGKWKLFFGEELEKYGGKLLFRGNLNKKDTMEITDVNNTLIREILSIWAEVNFEGSVKSQNQFLEQPLWHNSLIKVGNKPIFYKKLFLKGISKVKHIMRDYNKFFSLAEVSNIYNIQIQPLTFFGLVSS